MFLFMIISLGIIPPKKEKDQIMFSQLLLYHNHVLYIGIITR